MAKRPDVLVLGEGPPPPEATPAPMADLLHETRFPTLRLWQGVRALVDAGLSVAVAAAGPEAPSPPRRITLAGAPVWWNSLGPEGLNAGVSPRLVRELDPVAVISLGPFGPARAAAFVPAGVPTWIDLPGDPMAEAQLRAAEEAEAPARYHGVLCGALARGDAFSVCSSPQRAALWGQLGLLGRLAPGDLETPPVRVVPPGIEPAWTVGGAAGPRPPIVALVGGINHWADVDGLVEALAEVLATRGDASVLILGGEVPGHASGPAERLRAGLQARGCASRCRWEGWVEPGRLIELLDGCRVAVSLDRGTVEAALGARTRLGLGVARGLWWVVTPLSEDTREVCARGLALPVDAGAGRGAAAAILRALEAAPPPVEARTRWLEERHPSVIFAPVVAWAREPRLSPAAPSMLLEETRARLRAEADLAAVHQSPTWRLLSPVHRWLGRRVRAFR